VQLKASANALTLHVAARFKEAANTREIDNMANYAVRVELRGKPSFETYEKLHALMATFGFYQTVNGQKGISNLPHATYYGSSTFDCSAVRDFLGSSIRTSIQSEMILFVVQAATWALG
jgi:hypothetical protein